MVASQQKIYPMAFRVKEALAPQLACEVQALRRTSIGGLQNTHSQFPRSFAGVQLSLWEAAYRRSVLDKVTLTSYKG